MNIKEILQEITNTGDEIYSVVCKVISVSLISCECQPLNGDAPILDVRLLADDTEDRYVVVPKIDSLVLVSFLNKNAGYVSLVSEVEGIYYKKGTTIFEVNNKFLLQAGAEDLFKLIKDLIAAMKNEKHMTNTGVTISLTPASVLAYDNIETRFKTLLKEV